MNKSLFIELIDVSIGKQGCLSNTPNDDEWYKLYAMAIKQSLVGICFNGLQRLKIQQQSPPESLYNKWMCIAAKIHQKNEFVNHQCVELQEKISFDGFRSCILKGQGNLNNYGEIGMLRQPGDIDLWVDGDFNRIIEYLSNVAPTDGINQHHAQFKVFNDTAVELHFYPLKLNNPIKQKILNKYFSSLKDFQFDNRSELPNEGGQITTVTNEFNIVFQLMHIYHHMMTEGVGLRQIMDYYMVLQNLTTSSLMTECKQNAKDWIEKLNLTRFASALMWVLVIVFENTSLSSYDTNPSWMIWKSNKKDGEFLLNEIMKSGNFGKYDDRQRGLYTSKWNSFWLVHFKTIRFWRFDHWAWFWSPIERIKGFLWRRSHGFK